MSAPWLNAVDPLVKIGGLSVLLATTLLSTDPATLAFLGAGASFFVLTALFSHWRYWRFLAGGLSGIALISFLHWLLGGDDNAVAGTALRLFIFMGTSFAMMMTTDPAHLMRAMRRLPLPSGMILGLMVMWRCLPFLSKELASIRLACRLEGVRLRPWNVGVCFRYLLLPLIFAMMGFADDVSLALSSRGISLDKPRLSPSMSLGVPDGAFLLVLIATLIMAFGTA